VGKKKNQDAVKLHPNPCLSHLHPFLSAFGFEKADVRRPVTPSPPFSAGVISRIQFALASIQRESNVINVLSRRGFIEWGGEQRSDLRALEVMVPVAKGSKSGAARALKALDLSLFLSFDQAKERKNK